MAAIAYAEPAIYMPGLYIEPDSQPYLVNSGQTILRGDFVILSSNALSRAASDAHSAIVGLAQHGSVDIYSSASPSDSTLFGVTTGGTALQPGTELLGVKVDMARNNQYFEISLVQAWADDLVGTQAGLLLDSGSNLFVADNTQSDNCFNIVGKMDGPGRGTVGDTGARIIVYFLSTVLATI